MQPQQGSCRVSTDFDRFITHPAPLEPISVVRFARYLGRRYHSPQQLRFVPLLVDVWKPETSDKRAPGGISYTNTISNLIETLYRAATPHNTAWNDSQFSTSPRSRRHQRQVVDWFKKARFTSILSTAALFKLYPAFCCTGQLLRWSYKGFI